MFKGERDLSFDEARSLITRYRLDPDSGASSSAATLEDLAAEHDIALIEEVDLALGMGGGAFADMAETKGLVPFKNEWLRGLYSGPLSALRVVRGRGDSMQPTILDGDLVVVDTSQNNVLDQDRLWAVFWGDLGMIKRVRRAPGGKFLLMSDNQTVSAIEATDDELHVTGRVIWIGRRM
jgi:phage repressor protein C with HTH and peptisase S24 domain